MRALVFIIGLCFCGLGTAQTANECTKVKPETKRMACLEKKIDDLTAKQLSVKLQTISSGRTLCLYGTNFGVALQEDCNLSNNQWKIITP